MGKYFDLVYDGPPFVLFGTPHLTALAIITLCCFSYLYFRKVWGEKERQMGKFHAVRVSLFIHQRPQGSELMDSRITTVISGSS